MLIGIHTVTERHYAAWLIFTHTKCIRKLPGSMQFYMAVGSCAALSCLLESRGNMWHAGVHTSECPAGNMQCVGSRAYQAP